MDKGDYYGAHRVNPGSKMIMSQGEATSNVKTAKAKQDSVKY